MEVYYKQVMIRNKNQLAKMLVKESNKGWLYVTDWEVCNLDNGQSSTVVLLFKQENTDSKTDTTRTQTFQFYHTKI